MVGLVMQALVTVTAWQKNVVYSMLCSVCDAKYIGKTSRSVGDRFTEHFRQARMKTSGTPWGTHFEVHHDASMPSSPFTKACSFP